MQGFLHRHLLFHLSKHDIHVNLALYLLSSEIFFYIADNTFFFEMKTFTYAYLYTNTYPILVFSHSSECSSECGALALTVVSLIFESKHNMD